jgi:hypothetical protein
MKEVSAMNAKELPAAASVSYVAEVVCNLSRSRFYDLMNAGVFPKPMRHPSSKRPIYTRDGIEQCVKIQQTGLGFNGEPVVFNRKLTKSRKPVQGRNSKPNSTQFAELTDALKSLGLTTTHEAVTQAVGELFPNGDWKETGQGEVIRRVFLQLQTTGATK